ncbi:MAG: hypothetical protein ABIS86_04835 [Streptosporangiaceae bacterium]
MRVIFCAAAALLAGGCSTAGAGTFSPAGPPSQVSAQVPGQVPAQAATRADLRAGILQAYRDYHRVFELTVATNRLDEVDQVATGRIAAHLAALVRDQRRHRIVERGHAALNPELVWVKDDTALVVDCVVTGLTRFDARSGRRVGPRAAPRKILLRSTLKRSGSWRVAELEGAKC